MTAFFPHVRVHALTANTMSPYDPALRSTRSVNTPEAWAEAARWLAAQRGRYTAPPNIRRNGRQHT